MPHGDLERLDALLDRERAALLSGDFRTIAALLPDKKTLLDRLQGGAKPNSTIDALSAKARRNGALYDAALAGLRAAAERLGGREGQRALRVYTPAGRSAPLSASRPRNLQKRA